MSKKVCYISVLILILAVVVVYFYGSISASLVKKNLQLSYANKMGVLNTQYQANLKAKTNSLMESLAIPLSFFIKNAIEANNFQSVNDCFDDLVKQKGFKDINLVKDGKILIGTNKKYEGATFEKLYPKGYANFKQITIQSAQPSFSNIVIPIMSTNKQLAFVVITFRQ